MQVMSVVNWNQQGTIRLEEQFYATIYFVNYFVKEKI